MDRIEIESTLNRDRVRLLEVLSSLPAEQLTRPTTPSEHDPAAWWSIGDHFVHTALIEHDFCRIIRRFVSGDANPITLMRNEDGSQRSMPEIMKTVHAFTEDWAVRHRGKALSELVAVTQGARAETLALLSELSDEQIALKVPGAPWADGTVGGMLGLHGAHAKRHFQWARDGLKERGGWVEPPAGEP